MLENLVLYKKINVINNLRVELYVSNKKCNIKKTKLNGKVKNNIFYNFK